MSPNHREVVYGKSTISSAAEPVKSTQGVLNTTAIVASDSLSISGIAVTPKFAPIALSATGAVVAAVASRRIRVLSYVLSSAGTVNAKWQSASTDLTGLSYLVANSNLSSGSNNYGYFQTAVGEALNLNLSGSIAVGGHITYIEVP